MEEPELLNLEFTSEGRDYFYIKLDRGRIDDLGRNAIQNFILKLHVYKHTADTENGKPFFMKYSEVDAYWSKVREIVIKNDKPRRFNVQSVLKMDSACQFSLKEYDESFEGIIRSACDRFGYWD